MKEFFKYVAATIVGIISCGIIMGILGLVSIIGMVSSSQKQTTLSDNSVLVLKLEGEMSEQSNSSFLNDLQDIEEISFEKTLKAIHKAQNNENIKGIYLEAGSFSADLAQLQELRKALADFKKSGKWIISYGEIYTQGTYYLASLSDKIYINPSGTIDWHGVGGELTYVKDLLAKVGVRMVPVKVGKYKSAVEMFTQDKMSAENREQTERYINGYWKEITTAVSNSRKISVDSLNAYADRLIATEDPQNLQKYKMVDGFYYTDDIKNVIKEQLKIEKEDAIKQVSISEMANVEDKSDDGDDKIAVYYAFGDIVDSEIPSSIFGSDHQIIGKDLVKDFQDLAEDEDVKAVVIRINSGGGSAYASEQIWHQVMELKKVKPVVVSMSGAAASGGYYMSCGANWIVADPMTITGSIGIFGLFPDASDLMTNKLGLKYDEVKTNRNSVMYADGHFFTPEQLGYLQAEINRGYMLFKKRVSDGRHLTMAQVEALAQGHVYLAEDAIKLKLVDQLGGLDDAIAKAAQLAKTKSYYTENYPAPTDWMDKILNSTDNKNSYLDTQLKATLGEYYKPMALMSKIKNMDRIQAMSPVMVTIK